MKEIGGYFGLEKLISNEYYNNLIALNSGRNALLYILRAKSIKKIYIPFFICDSIINMLKNINCNFEFYSIDSNFSPIFNKKLENGEYIYIVNYYGQLKDKDLIRFREKYKNIIIDNAQAFFQKPLDNMDTIYTCRKFFGVPDGAYLSTDKILNDNLKIDISKERMKHILGRYEGKASQYYNDFYNIDKLFDNEPLKYMSKLTHNILGAIDYKEVYKVRNKNYKYLENKFRIYNKLKINTPDCAFAYPLYLEEGMKVKKLLADIKVYIPTLWPNVLTKMNENSIEYDYAANILPLPCDQRYNEEDMEYLSQILMNYLT